MRVLLTSAMIVLLGLFGWGLWEWYRRPPTLKIACLSVAEYEAPDLPPVFYTYEDLDGLKAKVPGEFIENPAWQDSDSAHIRDFAGAVSEMADGRSHLLIYVKAHGISRDRDAYLIGSDYGIDKHTARVPIEELLDAAAKGPARLKLLVLDTGHLESEPRVGMLVNEFPALVEQHLTTLDENSNLWVLLSNSFLERSHVSVPDQRSVFNHYLTQGLAGAADGWTARETNNRVELDELHKYVRSHVQHYVEVTSENSERQTPRLLRAGKGAVSSDDLSATEIHLTVYENPEAPAPEAQASRLRRANASRIAMAPAPRRAVKANIASPALLSAGAVSSGMVSLLYQPEASSSAPPADTATKAPQDTPADSSAKATKEANPAEKAGKAEAAGPSNDKQGQTTKRAAATSEKPAETKANPSTAIAPAAAKQAAPTALAAKPRKKRSDLEQQLFEQFQWLDSQSRAAADADWRLCDYAPHLGRLYLECLVAYRQRTLAGSRFLANTKHRDAMVSRLLDLERPKMAIRSRKERFPSAPAARSYKREPAAEAAIRSRNEAFFLLPALAAQSARLKSHPLGQTMARDLIQLAAATAELDRVLATTFDATGNEASRLEAWKSELRSKKDDVEKRLNLFKQQFAESYAQQQQRAKRNQPPHLLMARVLADSPFAKADEREALDELVNASALSFAAAEKSGTISRSTRRNDDQALEQAWSNAIPAIELQIALARLSLAATDPTSRDELETAAQQLIGAKGDDGRTAAVRRLGALIEQGYRRVPDKLGDKLKSGYVSWRQAETIIRLADARHALQFEEFLRGATGLKWTDPIAGVPLDGIRLIGPGHTLSLIPLAAARPNALSPQGATLRFESNEPLPEVINVRLSFDPRRLRVRSEKEGELQPDITVPLTFTDPTTGPRHARQRELLFEARDEQGGASQLSVTWLNGTSVPPEGRVSLSHPKSTYPVLVVAGQRGTFSGNLRRSEQGAYFIEQPLSGAEPVMLRLRPFSGGMTYYDFRIKNQAEREKNYRCTVYAVPPPDENSSGASTNAIVAATLNNASPIGPTQMASAPPSGTAVLPIYPAPAPAAPAASKDEKPEKGKEPPSAEKGDEKPKQYSLNHGMLLVIEEADGQTAEAAATSKIRLLVQFEPQRPSEYLEPDVGFRWQSEDSAEVSVDLTLQDASRASHDGTQVRLEIVPEEVVIRRPSLASQTTLDARTPADRLLAYLKPTTGVSAQLNLHVDGYPRAFTYDLPADGTRSKLPAKDRDLHAITFPRDGNFPQFYNKPIEKPLEVPFAFDVPPRLDASYFARVYIVRDPERRDYHPQDRAIVFSRDRSTEFALVKSDRPGQAAIETRVSDWVARFDNMAQYENQRVHLRAEIVHQPEGGVEEVFPYEELVLYIDSEPPTVVRDNVRAGEDDRPVLVRPKVRTNFLFRALDDISGIEKVEVGAKVAKDAMGNESLQEPEPLKQIGASTYQAVRAFGPPGHKLYVQATDRSGNKSAILPVDIEVYIEPMPGTQAAQPGRPKNNKNDLTVQLKIEGDATFMKLKLEGEKSEEVKLGSSKTHTFKNLPAGKYTISAEGALRGSEVKGSKEVTLQPGPPAATVSVPVK